MKIKTKKQLNLPQLLEWAWDNGKRNLSFRGYDKEGSVVYISINENGEFTSDWRISKDQIFTVEVEETLTKDTVFPSLAVIRKQHFASGNSTVHVTKINNKSINALIDKQPINSTFEYKEIYLMDDDKLGQCIWRDGKMVE